MMSNPIQIFVLDCGHVLVGRARRHPDLAFHWRLEPGRVIRRWGTADGLSQLAARPLTDTILDTPANVTVPFLAIIYILDAEESGWRAHLPTS